MSRTFGKDDPAIGALLGWWRGLENDRGARADLRRCGDLMQVMQSEAFHSARLRLIAAGMPEAESKSARVATIVALAAHVKSITDEALPVTFSAGEKPPVSPLRFRQILDAVDDDELFTRLRRVMPLIEGRANLPALAASVWYWGDSVRKRWVYDYQWPTKQSA